MIGKMKRDDGKLYTMEFKIPERPSTSNNVFVFDNDFELQLIDNLLIVSTEEEGLTQRIELRLENFAGLFSSEYPEIKVYELFFSNLNLMLKYNLRDKQMSRRLVKDQHMLENILRSNPQ